MNGHGCVPGGRLSMGWCLKQYTGLYIVVDDEGFGMYFLPKFGVDVH